MTEAIVVYDWRFKSNSGSSYSWIYWVRKWLVVERSQGTYSGMVKYQTSDYNLRGSILRVQLSYVDSKILRLGFVLFSAAELAIRDVAYYYSDRCVCWH